MLFNQILNCLPPEIRLSDLSQSKHERAMFGGRNLIVIEKKYMYFQKGNNCSINTVQWRPAWYTELLWGIQDLARFWNVVTGMLWLAIKCCNKLASYEEKMFVNFVRNSFASFPFNVMVSSLGIIPGIVN